MKKRKKSTQFIRSFCVLISFLILSVSLCAEDAEYQYKETEELVELVNDAVVLIEEKGKDVFAEFAVQDSKWRHDDKYVFAIDPEGMVYAHASAALVGTNVIELTDVNGKPFIKWILIEVSGEDSSGWSHYLWNIPGQDEPTWKSTYVQSAIAPSGKKYIAGCGLYNMKMERAFIVDQVNEAADMIEVEGVSAFDVLRDPKSEFIFNSNYVFVLDEEGTLLVHPEIEGTNLYDAQDVNGKYFIREILEVGREDGSGWVDYWWSKPGEDKTSSKSSYIRQIEIDGDIFVVGVGVYLE
ncbi:MAG: cache domain-containing protein [Candidatus Celaenobacter antarcticus]|nr:cache domain-containing protein [Candidatus Celaenobacter antarcticus]